MKSRLLWEIEASPTLTPKCPIYSLCFKLDQSQLIVACANDLIFINPKTGQIDEVKKIHQAPIRCIRCSFDGVFFASSSIDGFVFISRSANNEPLIKYGSTTSTKTLCWSPSKQMLISCSLQEFHVWQPDEIRAARYKIDQPIISCSFSPTGSTFLLSFDNGDVYIYDSSNIPNVLQTYKFSTPLTTISYVLLENTEYIIATDMGRHVSLFKAADKSLVGKNSLTFEPLSFLFVDGFFVFSGISGRICLLTSNLSFLGEIDTKSDFIWDMAINKTGQLAIARRDGFVELRTIEFGLLFAHTGSIVAYRTNANSIAIKDVLTQQPEHELSFLKIIHSIHMNRNILLIHFNDSLSLFNFKTYKKICEIPGNFEKCLFALTETFIVFSRKGNLRVIDQKGPILFQFEFRSKIKYISSCDDGVIIGCKDGTISFIVNNKTHLIMHHTSPIEWVERKEQLISVIDQQHHCFLYDSFTSSVLKSIDYCTSFVFNDRIKDLYAITDGLTISVYYKDCEPMQLFVEGTLLAFIKNKLIVSNSGAIEIVSTLLPYKELIQRNMWDDVCHLVIAFSHRKRTPNPEIEEKPNDTMKLLKLIENESFDDSHELTSMKSDSDEDFQDDEYNKLILDECIRRESFDIAPLLINNKDKSKFFLFGAILPNSPKTASDLFRNSRDEKNGISDPRKLEENGDSQKALDGYASKGDWDSVLRLAKTSSTLVRQMADFNIPHEYSSKVADLLLQFGFSDSAIRVLSNSKDMQNLAKAQVYLGKWIEAISLTRLSPSVSTIVYPKMCQLLFEANMWFESLVCLFVVNDSDIRDEAIDKMNGSLTTFDQYSFITLMKSFNEPERYWSLLDASYVYICLDRVMKSTFLLPLSFQDAINTFYMCHFILAFHKFAPIRGVDISEILVHFLFASAILGMKRWVAFALREIMQLEIDDNVRRMAQLSALMTKETALNQSAAEISSNRNIFDFKCPKCGNSIFASGRLPLLVCGLCGMKIAYSAYSGRPLPLLHISYNSSNIENLMEIIEAEPKGDEPIPKLTTEFVTDEFILKTPPEYFVVQNIKPTAGIRPQLWLNPTLASYHVCKICGAMMDEIDFEKSFLDTDHCPICRGNEHDVEDSQILAALRSFEPDSPILF